MPKRRALYTLWVFGTQGILRHLAAYGTRDAVCMDILFRRQPRASV